MQSKHLMYGAVAAACLAAGAWALWPQLQSPPQPANLQPSEGPFDLPRDIKGAISVDVPSSLSVPAKAGKKLFDENCAACHGVNAAGTESGPPLVHFVYEPGHHGDASFYNAVQNGVRAHHWRYGDMAAVDGVTDPQIADIIAYVREAQRANGIN